MNLWRVEIKFDSEGHPLATAIVRAVTPIKAKLVVAERFKHGEAEKFFDKPILLKCKQIGVAGSQFENEALLCWEWEGSSPTDWRDLWYARVDESQPPQAR